jgi:hypothetical protein
MFRCASICLVYLFLIAAGANAQTFDEKYGKMISDDAAREAIKLALKKIGTAVCESNRPCAAASADEFDRPPITVIDGRAAMVFGIKSALAQWCGLDWKRSFLPMIAFGKQKMRMSDRQMQLMTLIHGDFQGRQFAFYSKSGQCPPQLQQQLDAQLPKLNR